MYSIILKDGKIINIEADDMMVYEKTNIVSFYCNKVIMVAEINMDDVVGWAKTDFIKNEE